MSKSKAGEPIFSRALTKEQAAEWKKNVQKNIVKSSDMPSEVQSEAVDLIVSAIDNIKTVNGTYEAACKQVKEAMDRKFGPSWHCIIGEGFGFNCTFQTKSMIFLYYQGNMAILLFKC